jgi:adenylate kinase family enzyme
MIIFLGTPGSGKSVQGRLLSKTLGCDYISVSELLRTNSDSLNQQKMINGVLLDDNTAIGVVNRAISNISKGKEFIIDGFPRTLVEAQWITNRQDVDSIKVIRIKVNQTEIIERLRLRNRRDDNIVTISNRIDAYEFMIRSIMEEFKSKHVDECDIDGSTSIESVHNQIMNCIQHKRRT